MLHFCACEITKSPWINPFISRVKALENQGDYEAPSMPQSRFSLSTIHGPFPTDIRSFWRTYPSYFPHFFSSHSSYSQGVDGFV